MNHDLCAPDNSCPLQVLLIGGGMICHDQILPSLYHLQRLGLVGEITVTARHGRTLQKLASNSKIQDAFPGRSFKPLPDFNSCDIDEIVQNAHREALGSIRPRNIVFIALPDPLHYEYILEALEAQQHVIAVKPLVLSCRDAKKIADLAAEKGLFVGVDYHKRFDDRALMARMHYRAGELGEFRLGQASLLEPYYYRNSNFQNWCTSENTDLFTYVGCHYIDQVHFITVLLPTEVSVYGIMDEYPNGAKGFLWTDGRVIWENGACLNVINALGYPDRAPGGNAQGLKMFNRGHGDSCLLFHDDQYRGVKYAFDKDGVGGKRYSEPNPDYMKLVYRGGKGCEPVGYGYRSIEALVKAVRRVNQSGAAENRRAEIKVIDDEGIIATPGNSNFNELVIEAGRMSILNSGRPAVIEYGSEPRVRFKEWQ